MNFEIILTGLNYKRAGVEIREKYSLADYCTPSSWIVNHDSIQESLVLSTCNRVEVLGVGQDIGPELVRGWASKTGGDERELRQYLYQYVNLDAVRHIFEVASSLDSMVIGEPQILGQMKSAYRNSVNGKKAGPIINRLMHKAFSVAKRVRNETAIAANAVSVSYAAVELAKCIFGDLKNNSALLLGAGEMAELSATHLMQAGIKKLYVANRTLATARELAARFGAEAVPFEEIFAKLSEIDIIIASTASKQPILNKENVAASLKNRKNQPMFFIDIAVPRDIAADVNTLDNVYLYDIDDLKEIVDQNRASREKEAQAAKLIVEEEAARFVVWLQSLDLQPTIVDLIRRGENIGRREVEKTLKKLGNPSREMESALETLASSIIHKLNHAPLQWLKHPGMGKLSQQERLALTRAIFKLDEEPITAGRKE